MGESCRLQQQIWPAYLDETVKYVPSTRIEEQRNKNEKALLNTFSAHNVEVLGNLVDQRLQDQGFASFFKVFISLCREYSFLPVGTIRVWRSRRKTTFLSGIDHSYGMKFSGYLLVRSLDRARGCNEVFVNYRSGKNGSVLRVAGVLLQFRLKF